MKSSLLKFGRVINDASFVLLEPCSLPEKCRVLSQLARIAFAPNLFGGSAVVGHRNLSAHYLNRSGFWQAYHEIFMRQMYFFSTNTTSPLIFDCGANIGLATLYFKTLYPDCSIEAFEPDPVTFGVLEQNVENNHLRKVVLHRCALWDSDGELEFYTDASNPGRLDMGVVRGKLGTSETRITVPASRLSRLIEGKTIEYMKIDVEGAEERLLSDLAAQGTLKNIQRMTIEYHQPDGGQPSRFSRFLRTLEDDGFDYELYADLRPRVFRNHLHDVLICARRRDCG